MKKKLAILLIPLLLIVIIIFSLLTSGSLRHKIFRLAVEGPGLLYYFKLRTATKRLSGPNATTSNFIASSSILIQQLSLAESFSGKMGDKSAMLPMLLANTQFVMRQAQLLGQAQSLLPYLERLADYQSDIFIVQIWLAEALLESQPQKALEHAQIAQRILPNDDRSYRIAIQSARKLNQDKVIREECAKYQTAKLGAIYPYEYETLFFGVGVNNFGIEIADKKGGSKLVVHKGLLVAKDVVYGFSLPHPVTFQDLRLHISALPGLSFNIKNINMYREGKLIGNIEKDAISISARHGFIQGKTVVTVSKDGDLFILTFPDSKVMTADRVDMQITLKRLPLLLDSACS
jgi:hypothetical protein